MKKFLLLLSMILLLTGCGGKEISGEVASVTPQGYYMAISLAGREQVILADRDTHIFSFSDEIPSEQLLIGQLCAPRITASGLRWTAEGYVADSICVDSTILPEPYILSDGTSLNIRKHHLHTAYETPDGTILLWETDPIGPENVHGGSAPSLDSLSSQAQTAITAYYEEQGLLYDLDAQLETAYQAYLKSEDKLLFQCHHLSQEVIPSAASEKIISFSTILTLPVDGNHVQELRYNTVFERSTGDIIEICDLFRCSEDEIAETFLTAAKLQDPDLMRKMINAFRPEYLILGPSALELWFPKNTLEGTEESNIVCADYGDLTELLYPWAIPD